jgi:tetratricopeptide (TPR) repeat protein
VRSGESMLFMMYLRILFLKQLGIAALLLNQRKTAIRYWEQIRLLKPRDALIPAAIAQLKADLGLKNDAIVDLKASLYLDANQSHVWYNLGFLQQELNEQMLAIEAFDKAILLNDRFDLALYGKALSLIKLGRAEESIALLKRNTELQPFSPYGWYQLAHVYHRLGDQVSLGKVIAKVASFEPDVALQLQRETSTNAVL